MKKKQNFRSIDPRGRRAAVWLAVGLLAAFGAKGQDSIDVTPDSVSPGGLITVSGTTFGSQPQNHAVWIQGDGGEVVPVDVLQVSLDELVAQVGWSDGSLQGDLRIASGDYMSFLDRDVDLDGRQCTTSGSGHFRGELCYSETLIVNGNGMDGYTFSPTPDLLGDAGSMKAAGGEDAMAYFAPSGLGNSVPDDLICRLSGSGEFFDTGTCTPRTCRAQAILYGVAPDPNDDGCFPLDVYVLEVDCHPCDSDFDDISDALGTALQTVFGDYGLDSTTVGDTVWFDRFMQWYVELFGEP